MAFSKLLTRGEKFPCLFVFWGLASARKAENITAGPASEGRVTPGAGKGSADYRHHTTMGLADYRRAGNSEGYPPEGAVMLQKCQAFRKHEAPGRGAGR